MSGLTVLKISWILSRLRPGGRGEAGLELGRTNWLGKRNSQSERSTIKYVPFFYSLLEMLIEMFKGQDTPLKKS